MDYNSLKYIVVVDKHQSITKAAEELFLTQPNISKAIQNVEKEINIEIFTRTSKGVITTPQGKEFIRKATKIIKNFDDFTKEFSPSNQTIFNMSIAHPDDIYFQNKIIDISKKFNDEKEINVNVLEGTTEEVIDMVIKETINLGVICINEHDLAYYKKLLLLNNLDYISKPPLELKATFHQSNPLSSLTYIDKNLLENQTLITTNTNDYYKYYNEKYHLLLSTNVVKVSTGFNQIAMLEKVNNSYLLSLPISDEILNIYNCKSITLNTGIGGWVTLFVYKKTTTLTNLEKEFINTL